MSRELCEKHANARVSFLTPADKVLKSICAEGMRRHWGGEETGPRAFGGNQDRACYSGQFRLSSFRIPVTSCVCVRVLGHSVTRAGHCVCILIPGHIVTLAGRHGTLAHTAVMFCSGTKSYAI